MEQALRTRSDDSLEFGSDRAGAQPAWPESDGVDKVLRFAMPPSRTAEAERPAVPVTARDFATAIDVVRDAAQAIKHAEERSREAESRTQSVAQRAAEELKHAEMRIQALESRVRAAESRTQDAETRAKEADAWLRQIFSTIADELPVRRPA